jgi:glycosyltransferase involved in cell wall biosynthesis
VTNPEFSVIVPVYNSARHIRKLTEAVSLAFTALHQSFELIFVNDRSPDNSVQLIQEVKKQLPDSIVLVDLKRNIGQYAATIVGLYIAKGNKIITMDADFYPVEKNFKNMIENISPSTELIYGELPDTHENSFRKSGSFLFNSLVKFSINKKVNSNGSSFRLVTRNFLNKVLPDIHEPMMLDIYLINATTNLKFIPLSIDVSASSSYSLFKLISPGFNLLMGSIFERLNFQKKFIPQYFIRSIEK